MFDYILKYIPEGILGLVIFTGLIQISPIKVNPWSYIAKKIGKACNEELIAEISSLELTLESHMADNVASQLKDCRRRILSFSDDLSRGVEFSKEHYNDVLEDIDYYESYCRANPDFPNNKALMSIENIKANYRKRFVA